jgi:hypothetical protein
VKQKLLWILVGFGVIVTLGPLISLEARKQAFLAETRKIFDPMVRDGATADEAHQLLSKIAHTTDLHKSFDGNAVLFSAYSEPSTGLKTFWPSTISCIVRVEGDQKITYYYKDVPLIFWP